MPESRPRRLIPFHLQFRWDSQSPVVVELPVRAGELEDVKWFGEELRGLLGYGHVSVTDTPSRGGRFLRRGRTSSD